MGPGPSSDPNDLQLGPLMIVTGLSVLIPAIYTIGFCGLGRRDARQDGDIGLRVVRAEDGLPLTTGQAIGRFFGYFVSSFVLEPRLPVGRLRCPQAGLALTSLPRRWSIRRATTAPDERSGRKACAESVPHISLCACGGGHEEHHSRGRRGCAWAGACDRSRAEADGQRLRSGVSRAQSPKRKTRQVASRRRIEGLRSKSRLEVGPVTWTRDELYER